MLNAGGLTHTEVNELGALIRQVCADFSLSAVLVERGGTWREPVVFREALADPVRMRDVYRRWIEWLDLYLPHS